MLRFFAIINFLLISVVASGDPITEKRVVHGPFAEKVITEKPLPSTQWSDQAKLWLGRSCAGEAGFTNYDECIGIAWVYATRYKSCRIPFVEVIRGYSSAVKDRSTRKRRWILHLNLEGKKPEGWPENVSWKKHRVFWLRLLEVLDDWASGHYKNPVEGANHYGGSMDTPGKKWIKVQPTPAWLYRNSFYRDL